MVEIKDICKTNDKITGNAYVEDCKTPVSLVYDISSDTFLDYTLPDKYSYCTWHMFYAKRFIKSLINEQTIPTEKLIIWY